MVGAEWCGTVGRGLAWYGLAWEPMAHNKIEGSGSAR
jgi:hypothetical protein